MSEDRELKRVRKYERINDIFARASMFIILFASIFIIFIFVAYLRPVRILEINNPPVKVSKKVIIQGEELEFVLDYCKYEETEREEIKINFEGRSIQPTFETIKHLPLGCHKIINHITVPYTLQQGEWKLNINILYVLSDTIYREKSYQFLTEGFQVDKSEVLEE